jgi:hypothetical protein
MLKTWFSPSLLAVALGGILGYLATSVEWQRPILAAANADSANGGVAVDTGASPPAASGCSTGLS